MGINQTDILIEPLEQVSLDSMYSLLKSCPHKTPWKWKCESESCSVVSDSLWPHGLYSLWNSPGHNTGVGSFSLLQGIFPTQGLNAGLLHCRRILYQLSHQGSPRILEWIAYPFSRGSSWPRNQTGVSCVACGFSTNWAMKEVRRLYPWNTDKTPWPCGMSDGCQCIECEVREERLCRYG